MNQICGMYAADQFKSSECSSLPDYLWSKFDLAMGIVAPP